MTRAEGSGREAVLHVGAIGPAWGESSSASRSSARRRVSGRGEDLKALVLRKRKVDETVVEALAHELTYDPFASAGELTSRVNARLGRDDLPPANIEAGLEGWLKSCGLSSPRG